MADSEASDPGSTNGVSSSTNLSDWCLPTATSPDSKDGSDVTHTEEFDLPNSFKEMLRAQFVRYGDKVKLCTKSHYGKRSKKGKNNFVSDGKAYVGIYEKPDGTMRVAIPPIGKNSPGTFTESVYEILPADDNGKRSGEDVKYGDVVVLVDEHGSVWNNKIGGFFEGYLGPKGRGTSGEMFISFVKNGRKQREMLYGDPGVFIDVADAHRHRTSYNYRLSNYKTNTSKCEGGYMCSDGSGTPLAFSIHPASGTPSLAYGSTLRDTDNSYLSKLLSQCPAIESVRLRHGKIENVVIAKPQYGAVFKVHNVQRDDLIDVVLYTGAKARVKVSELMQKRESIVDLSEPTGIFQKALKYDTTKTADPESDAGPHALQIICEKGVSASVSPKASEASVGHLGILLSFDKLAVLYLFIAYGLPYLLWSLIVILDHNQEAIRSTLGPWLFGSVQSYLKHYGAGNGASEGCNIAEAASFFSVTWALVICWLTGFATPNFIRNKVEQTKDGGEKGQLLLMTVSVTPECFGTSHNNGSDSPLSSMKQIGRSPWFTAGVDENGVPKHEEFARFLEGEKGDMAKALERWDDTIEWRESMDIDSILQTPHINFDIIKRYYPHYFCGMTKDNHQIYIERNVQVNLKALRENGLNLDDLLWHYVYTAEYQTRVLHPKTGCKDGKSLTILDVQGLKVRDFVGDVMQYVKRATNIAQDRYPERSFRIYIVNVPRWFDMIFRVVKPLLEEVTLAKIKIYRHGFEKDLLEEIDADILPKKYGGNYEGGDYETPQEIELAEFVRKQIAEADEQMKPVK